MSVLEWKKVDLLYSITLPSIKVHTEYEIAAHCSNLVKAPNGMTSTYIVLCDKNGYVHVFLGNDKNSKPIIIKCHENNQPIKLCALTTNNILTIVAQDDKNLSLGIYIYDLNVIKKEGYAFISSATLPATSTATSMQVAVIGPDKMFALGIGFEKGDLLLHFGKINRDISLNIRHHFVALSAIKGIQFDSCSYQQSDTKTCNVFVMGVDGVYSLVLSEKGSIYSKLILDNNKSMHNQYCTMSEPLSPDSFFVVGRDAAIYCFSRDCRGPCIVIEGQKEYLSWIHNHLVVVIKTQLGSVLIVVDVYDKLIVLQKRISNLLCIISGDNNAYHIITKGENSKNIYTLNKYKLQEHNTSNKVRILIAKGMHDHALRILEKDANAECENVANCRLQYADNLLQKAHLSRAVTEYAKTVGFIKPSNIISKLLSLRNNVYLMQYINQLLNTKHFKIEHKKLLDSCVDREKLNFRVKQLWNNRKDSTHHICDFRHISQRSFNITNLINGSEYLKATDFQNSDEEEILNFFREYGQEILSLYPQKVLEIAASLTKTQKVKDILRFLTVFSYNTEFCANLLADLIENSSGNDEKLSYYLLALYLSLWRDNKISAQYILEFLNRTSLSFEKIFTLTKVFLFKEDIGNFNNARNNPILACLDQQSLLNVLHKASASDNTIFDIKPFFIETFTRNLKDAESENESIKYLYSEININDSLVSQFKLNPMEFRNRSCDVCRQSLHMPSVFFLCQHSFHKDCISFNYSTRNEDDAGCALCTKNKDDTFVSNRKAVDSSVISSNIIRTISNDFASGIFNNNILNKCAIVDYRMIDNSHKILGRNIFKHTNNPFDDNYDSNLDC